MNSLRIFLKAKAHDSKNNLAANILKAVFQRGNNRTLTSLVDTFIFFVNSRKSKTERVSTSDNQVLKLRKFLSLITSSP